MRHSRLWLILLLALGSGGAAAYFALAYLQRHTPRLLAAERRQNVAVAARDLGLGAVLREEDIRLIEWPGEAVPPGYVSDVAALVGRGLITPVRANEVLLEGKLAPRGAGGGLSVAIPEGMRAVSTRVDDVIGVAGFVLPGTRVDVVLTLPPRADRRETLTRVLLQNIHVLAAGQQVQQDAQGKPVTVSVITLLVTPEQGEILILAANEGKIQLALRNTLDLDAVSTKGAYARTLLSAGGPSGGGVARRNADDPDARVVVEAYRGGVRTLTRF